MAPPHLPNDVVQNILAYLPIKDIFSLRRVNRDWYSIYEHAIKQHLSLFNVKISVTIGPSKKTIEPSLSVALECVGFDLDSRVFTFTPIPNAKPIYCKPNLLRQVKILFDEWNTKNSNGNTTPLEGTLETDDNNLNIGYIEHPSDPQAQELLKYSNLRFHKFYVEAEKKSYYLEETPEKEGEIETYLGDRDMILKCNIKDSVIPEEEIFGVDDEEEEDLESNKYSSVEVEFVQVLTSWLVGGTTINKLPQEFHKQIYPQRYSLLDKITSDNSILRYNRYCPSVLKWILSDNSKNDSETKQLCLHLHITKGDFTIRDKFEEALEERSIDRQFMWKYSFVPRFFIDPENSSDTFEQILDRFSRSVKSEDKNRSPNMSINSKTNKSTDSNGKTLNRFLGLRLPGFS
ncbi:hypothetical protein Glove_437g34 [Diversispora epigaea]|uniref:F-box domain-containing protein n=1 Tax=Diversispora epigaea TaxID=1348612 RepID=A0A397H089_9GLOM|nr:hypothetical protein Glove_437g34 [Diversispora epigaea]